MIDPDGLLMIEPEGQATQEPLVDEITRKMTAAWRAARHSDYGYRCFHQCTCGATSDNKDHWILVNNQELSTNSLAIHYLAFHRENISEAELRKVASLTFGEEKPTIEELRLPRKS